MRICSVRNCGGSVKSRGLCNKHYLIWKRHGDPDYVRTTVRNLKCTIDGCTRNQYARGWCTLHYYRWFSNGDPLIVQTKKGDGLESRFHRHVTIFDTNECIEWTEMTDRDGYGRFSFDNRTMRAHRVSFELHNGPIPYGAVIRHTCDNPPCVNPMHLTIGSVTDNNRDRVVRDRSAKGERSGVAKLTADQVREIRSLHLVATREELARRFGVSVANIDKITARKTWRHIK